jgi:hypothetical protein
MSRGALLGNFEEGNYRGTTLQDCKFHPRTRFIYTSKQAMDILCVDSSVIDVLDLIAAVNQLGFICGAAKNQI